MLDLRYIIENADFVKEKLSHRSGSYPIDNLLLQAEERKKIIQEVEALKAKKNEISKQVAILKKNKEDASSIINEMKDVNVVIKDLDEKLSVLENEIKETLLAIPNIPSESTPIGSDSDENLEIRKFSKPTTFSFEPKSHWEIGEALNLFDWPRASKITGTRFTVYRGLGAKLERAVINFMLDKHSTVGYTEILPPFLVNKDSMIGTGQLPKFVDDMYGINNTDYYLIPTAEVPVTNLHRNEILKESDLPIKYCAYTACFRGEAGSAGRDTKGLIRQHQFNKIELVKFAHPDNSFEELEKLTNDAEEILKALELPYRVVNLCTGDLGFSSTKTYDIEVWMPSYNRYVEISSCSNFVDYQARRANIKYRDTNGKVHLVHTLNGSGLAVGRTVAAIIENYQNADGSVNVPKALVKYLGTEVIK